MCRKLLFITLLILLATASGVSKQTKPAAVQKKELSFKVEGDVTLKATLYSAGKPGPGILLSHMCDGKGREAWDDLATRLAQSGFHVLTWNYRGIGDSEGERFQGGNMQQVFEYWRTKWGADAEAAFSLLEGQPGVDKARIGAGGASCGVYVSLLLAQRRSEQVKTLVLLAGPTDAETKAFVEKHDSLSILGVSSEEDRRSTSWTKDLVVASKNPTSKLVLYQNAGHGTEMLAKEIELAPMIIAWFRASLEKAKP